VLNAAPYNFNLNKKFENMAEHSATLSNTSASEGADALLSTEQG